MTDSDQHEWAVVRLATLSKKNEYVTLLFASVTGLHIGRPLPTAMEGLELIKIKKTGETIYFRRVIQSKKDAIEWYRSLGNDNNKTPIPTRENDRNSIYDGVPFNVSVLDDDQPWPALGLPIQDDILIRNNRSYTKPVPFIGSIPGRLHRRFGERIGFTGFLQDEKARLFIKRRMHVDLAQYQEYLGSAVYISPDPVVKQIDNFMTPAKDEHGERIIYRIVPHPGQELQGLKLTTFDKEAGLLTSFKTYPVPVDGIIEVDKGTCMGEYGFLLTHDEYGVLTYQPPAGFLRQMNLSIHAHSNRKLTVNVPAGSAKNSPRMEYQATSPSVLASESTFGQVNKPGVGARVNQEEMKRRIEAEANHYGQRWFSENSRQDAMHFIREIVKVARSRIIIADPYLGPLQISQFFYVLESRVSITLLTTKLGFENNQEEKNVDPMTSFQDALSSLVKHQEITAEIRVISPEKIHDRFLVVDDNVWFVGGSLNNIGEKASMIVRLPNPDEVIDKLEELIAKSLTLKEYKVLRDKGRTGTGEK